MTFHRPRLPRLFRGSRRTSSAGALPVAIRRLQNRFPHVPEGIRDSEPHQLLIVLMLDLKLDDLDPTGKMLEVLDDSGLQSLTGAADGTTAAPTFWGLPCLVSLDEVPAVTT